MKTISACILLATCMASCAGDSNNSEKLTKNDSVNIPIVNTKVYDTLESNVGDVGEKAVILNKHVLLIALVAVEHKEQYVYVPPQVPTYTRIGDELYENTPSASVPEYKYRISTENETHTSIIDYINEEALYRELDQFEQQVARNLESTYRSNRNASWRITNLDHRFFSSYKAASIYRRDSL